MSYEKATIIYTLNRIQNGELVLPAIQRDFVWELERMYKLLDSIFRAYPFSTMLFWNTRQRIQYREFTRDWHKEMRYTFQVKDEGKKGTMVLDGQQRLQTLFLALHGSYNHKILFFDLLSGIEPDDISEAKYHFEYLSSDEAEELNQRNSAAQYWIPLRDLAALNFGQIAQKSIQYLTKLGIHAESELGQRLSHNVAMAFGVLRGDETINYFTVDKDYGDDGVTTDLDEVLEIFVRVNSGGQVLSKSDLMFSLMQMHWEGAADSIAELIDRLNAMGRFEFDKDFILKTALVCVGAGAKYEVKKLRTENTVRKIESEFEKISEALIQSMLFVRDTARIVDDRILRSYNTLIPFVYFFYLQPNQQIKGEQTRLQMIQVLYLSLMTVVFSRYADNYIDQLVRDFHAFNQTNPGEFPFEKFVPFIQSKTTYTTITDSLLQNNILLLMNVLEGGTRLPEGRRSRRPEVDHIFPQSKLRERGVPEDQINHYANFRLVPAIDNNWKRDRDPQPYFAGNPAAAQRYFIPAEMLNYEQYLEFLEKRREIIWRQLNRFFGLNDDQPSLTEQDLIPKLDEHEADIRIEQPQAEWRKTLTYLLSPEEQAHPILRDQSSWLDIFRQVGFNPQWSGRYYWALYKAGIRSVGDFAVAVMALKIKVTHQSYDMNFYAFASNLPDGSKCIIPTREFGGYAWKNALNTLVSRGLHWEDYLLR
jgi:uncharacterized protein with ParB-like and HNH nuclease domain